MLCDLDGTLVDRAATFRQWAVQFARRHGQDDAFVEWLVLEDDDGFNPRRELFATLKDRLGLREDVAELHEAYTAQYSALFRCDAAVVDALKRARTSGWSIAVVTNGPATQVLKLQAAGVTHLVDTVCMSGVEDAWKPDRRLLDIAAARCAATLAGAWMIGDSAEADIGAAAAAGIQSVWISPGRRWPRLDYRPTAQVPTFADAVDHVLATPPSPSD